MSPLPKNILKTFFEIGDRPTQQQFGTLIDSSLNLVDDRHLLGLKLHNAAVQYTPGDTVLYNGLIYEALVSSLGTFIPAQWLKLNYGALNYAGTWNALTNSPTLASSTGNRGDYYVVEVAGTTSLDGENDWAVRDWAVFNGVKWEKVDNSDLDIQNASMVSFDNTVSGIVATNVQDAIDEIETRLDTVETDVDAVQLNMATKVASPTDGNFAGLNASGDLTDSGKNPGDYLHRGNTVPFSPSLQYDPATKGYIDSSIAAITATDVKYTPSGDLTAINVQDAIDEIELVKQDALGFTPVPDTRTVNGLALSGDISLTKNEIGLGNVPNVNATVASNITEDATHRFATDAEKSTWNGKQNAITTGTTSQYLRGDLSLATLDKTAVGLSNVPNVNATVASNITEDATHRFATDTEKSTWNAKQNELGFTPVPNTRTVNGYALNTNITLTKSDLGLGNAENLKVNLTATTDPAISNDATEGYAAGSRWINTSTQKEFVCISSSAGAAIWKRTSNTVFGDDYQFSVSSAGRTTTSSTLFQTKHTLITTALTGTYRIEWSAIVDNNKKTGEFRLLNFTDNQLVGSLVIYESPQIASRIPVGGVGLVVFTGSAKEFRCQFRDTGGGIQGIQDVRIEIYRVI